MASSAPEPPSTAKDPNETTEIVLPGVVEPDGLKIVTRQLPAPAAGQVVVSMTATGASYAENSMRRNRYPGQPKFPFVLGYDLVGEVEAVGDGVDAGLVGQRVAAVIKSGGWATRVLLDADDLLSVPDSLDPVEVEAVLLNGITAWQMLHRAAEVREGQTILVHGASGGVGSLLVQMAVASGVKVVGTGSPRSHDELRALGAEPLDYRDPDLAARLAALAPGGYDAVFDNIGGDSFKRSFDLLGKGGTLVGYGTNSQREKETNMMVAFLGILARFTTWSLTPNGGRSATFYNFWGGKATHAKRFHADQQADFRSVLQMLAAGTLNPAIARRFRLSEASEALAFADGRSVHGKVILEP